MVGTGRKLGRALALALVFSLPFFNRSTSSASKVEPPRSATRLKAPALLRLAMPDTSPTVDPALVADEQNVAIAGMLYSGLVRLDSHFRVVPDAAANWTISRDHRTYTFHLRKGLKFANGDVVTAQDFRFSITRSLSPALRSPSASTYLSEIEGADAVLRGKAKKVSGVRVLNASALRITTRWPVTYFLVELSYPTSFVLDAKQLKKLGTPENLSWYAHPNGSGPYKLRSWTPNTQMVLVRNSHYGGTTASLAEVQISLTSLPSAQVYSYVHRKLDVVSLCKRDGGIAAKTGVKDVPRLTINGLYMNMKNKALRKKSVRLALGLALNRARLVSSALGRGVTPFAGFIPPGEEGYNRHLRTVVYDARHARSELEAAGYKKTKRFPSLTLYYTEDPCDAKVGKLARSIVKSWRKNLHISVNTQSLTYNTLVAKVQSDALMLYLSSWSADYPDPHDWLSVPWESSSLDNDVHYDSSRFDTLTKTADVTWNFKERMRLYREAEQQLSDDIAWLPLYIPHRLVYLRPFVKNLDITGYGLIPKDGNWAEVRVTPGRA